MVPLLVIVCAIIKRIPPVPPPPPPEALQEVAPPPPPPPPLPALAERVAPLVAHVICIAQKLAVTTTPFVKAKLSLFFFELRTSDVAVHAEPPAAPPPPFCQTLPDQPALPLEPIDGFLLVQFVPTNQFALCDAPPAHPAPQFVHATRSAHSHPTHAVPAGLCVPPAVFSASVQAPHAETALLCIVPAFVIEVANNK